jgi:glycosyltransferase involved in cell wall biosynthesis
MQKTNFRFNVIVADDCSTDSNLEIIKRCAKGSDIEFIFLETDKTLGFRKNGARLFEACSAEYVATMEGDDFWTDPIRLQKHVDFLDHHLECSMSCNAFQYADYENGVFKDNLEPYANTPKGFRYLKAEDYIIRGGPNGSTCVNRNTVLKKILADEYYNLNLRSDWTLTIMSGMYGYIAFINEIMNVYRQTKIGVYAGSDIVDRTKRFMVLADEMDKYTGYKYSDVFAEKKRLEKENNPEYVQHIEEMERISKQEEQEFKINEAEQIGHSEYREECPHEKKCIEAGYSIHLTDLHLQGTKEEQENAFLKRTFRIVKNLTPPLIIWMFKALTPPFIWDRLRNKLYPH